MSHTIQCPYCRRAIELALNARVEESLERTTIAVGVDLAATPDASAVADVRSNASGESRLSASYPYGVAAFE